MYNAYVTVLVICTILGIAGVITQTYWLLASALLVGCTLTLIKHLFFKDEV